MLNRLFFVLLLATAACSSVPQGQRVLRADGFGGLAAPVAVLDVAATIGGITADGTFEPDPAASEASADALQGALVRALRARGVEARPVVLAGRSLPAGAVLALDELYDQVHEEGLAARGRGLGASSVGSTGALSELVEEDYVLVPVASGAYSTGGRRASQAAGALLAVGLGVGYVQSGGGQYAVLGLYEVDSGELVWLHKDAFGRPSLKDAGAADAVANMLLEPLSR